MLKTYLNQQAEHRTPSNGTDDRGQPIYGTPATVRCRRQEKIQNVLSSTGQVIQTQHVYYLVDPVAEGDMLDGKVIMAVSLWVGLGGKILGYKAVM